MSLRRRKPLRPNPDKVREFNDRARGSLSRTKLSRGRSEPKPRISRDVRREAMQRTNQRCCCGAQAFHLHHVLPKREWPDLVDEVDNLVPLCVFHHELHEKAMLRLYRYCLPEGVWALAEEAQAGRYTGISAVAYLERTYPEEKGPAA